MCFSPTEIPNPYYRCENKGLSYLHNCWQAVIAVPCGKCPECIRLKQDSYVQRIQMESLTSWFFFVTLTYNNQSLPIYGTSTGRNIKYADYRDFSLMVKRLRNDNALCYPFKTFCVSEFGTEGHRPHFHALFAISKEHLPTIQDARSFNAHMFSTILNYWQRNYGGHRNPDYRPLCTYIRRFYGGRLHTTYDCHFIEPSFSKSGVDDVSHYVLKYMFPNTLSEKGKKSIRFERRLQQALRLNLPEFEYKKVWSTVRPCLHASLGFGLGTYISRALKESIAKPIVNYIRRCIDDSDSFGLFYAAFFNRHSGKPSPLSLFFKKYFYTVQDAHTFYYRSQDTFPEKSQDSIKCLIEKTRLNYQKIVSNDVSSLFDELYSFEPNPYSYNLSHF